MKLTKNLIKQGEKSPLLPLPNWIKRKKGRKGREGGREIAIAPLIENKWTFKFILNIFTKSQSHIHTQLPTSNYNHIHKNTTHTPFYFLSILFTNE